MASASELLAILENFSAVAEEYRDEQKGLASADIDAFRASAGQLAVAAESRGCRFGARPFSDVEANWYRCNDPDVFRSIAELRAKLTAESNVKPPDGAHFQRLFPKGPLENPETQECIEYLFIHRGNGRSDNELLQEKTGKHKSYCQSIQGRIRKARDAGQTSLKPAQ
jgi:hypothetical protein